MSNPKRADIKKICSKEEQNMKNYLQPEINVSEMNHDIIVMSSIVDGQDNIINRPGDGAWD